MTVGIMVVTMSVSLLFASENFAPFGSEAFHSATMASVMPEYWPFSDIAVSVSCAEFGGGV